MGYLAGFNLTSGSNNLLLGYEAGVDLTSGSGNIVIGYSQNASAPGAANELNIGGLLFGNLGSKTIGISTRTPQAALDIVSTGNTPNVMAQIWRDSGGNIISSVSATGTMKAARFEGSGSELIGLNASELDSGIRRLRGWNTTDRRERFVTTLIGNDS